MREHIDLSRVQIRVSQQLLAMPGVQLASAACAAEEGDDAGGG